MANQKSESKEFQEIESTGTNLYSFCAVDDEDQEAPFQEIDAHRLAAEVAWVRFFIREARRRGYTVEDIIALLDDPGMTEEVVVERILSTKGPRPN